MQTTMQATMDELWATQGRKALSETRYKPTYSFGHFKTAKTPSQDNHDSSWWNPGTCATTNAARNRDLEHFWEAAKADPANLERAQQSDVSKLVKAVHIKLGSDDTREDRKSSLYMDTFCKQHVVRDPFRDTSRPLSFVSYAEASADAKRNRAMGTGSNMSLAHPF